MSQILSSTYTDLAKLFSDANHFISPAKLQSNLWEYTVVICSNVVIENFFHTLKRRIIHSGAFTSQKEIKAALFEYIEI